ncbi:MAG: TonB family protein [Pseudomonadota bacterium]
MTRSLAVVAGRPGGVLTGAFAVAVVINLALLLLIGALIGRREAGLVPAPAPRPVDFIRIVPKTEEPKPVPPPSPKVMTEVAPQRPPPAPVKPSGMRRAAPAAKSQRARVPSAGVAAPRLDISEQGTGAPLAPVPGSDSRLAAPPAQWNPAKTPAGGAGSGSNGDNGSDARDLIVLSRVLPEYPPRSLAQKIEGWVQIEIDVGPTGTVTGARVVAASPPQVFDRAVLEAIRFWRFKPAFREGRAVAQRARLTVEFSLEDR